MALPEVFFFLLFCVQLGNAQTETTPLTMEAMIRGIVDNSPTIKSLIKKVNTLEAELVFVKELLDHSSNSSTESNTHQDSNRSHYWPENTSVRLRRRCLKGAKGDRGIQGEDGMPGINGRKGEQGVKGSRGEKGEPGNGKPVDAKTETHKECETTDCEMRWFEGRWEKCSSTCGSTGVQLRVVYCYQMLGEGQRIALDDENCTAPQPAVRRSCNRFACPVWQIGPWTACSEICGDAFQYRSVTCRSEKEGEEGKLLPADSCPQNEMKLETRRECNLAPCQGLNFFTSEWKLCEKCNDTLETRNVSCQDLNDRVYPLKKCLNENVTDIPIDVRQCAMQPECHYEWTLSEWSECSTQCGRGHQSRRVVCAIRQLDDIEVVDDLHCSSNKPETRQNCTQEEECSGIWYTRPWSNCTKPCSGGAGGRQTRAVVCIDEDVKVDPKWCDEMQKPSEEQECNTKSCTICFDSECKEIVLRDDTALTTIPEKCEVTNKAGTKVALECPPTTKAALNDERLLNAIEVAITTLNCSKTEFGCCPDWYTPAEEDDKSSCPAFALGTCNETHYGCCPDDVTLARGPNLEGCGEPSCAGSFYGCCADHKTITFGPHYQGCERSFIPCELTEFGCCRDGETAAFDNNDTGCGENCLMTKFGCCPNGVTVSKGLDNEGCGCVYARFGCCPDGKSVAEGPGFLGCPETCAQTQFGCCPDGQTPARGDNKEGCPCKYTRFGCCPDGETTALGTEKEGCDNCVYSKYGCCPDQMTKALDKNGTDCPTTTTTPLIAGSTVAPAHILACSLPYDQGTMCHPEYHLQWFYDKKYGRCGQFYYGGCNGNENRFATEEMCKRICVEPPGRGRCYLPKVEEPARCDNGTVRYWYDYTKRQCVKWSGCLRNSNNFDSLEECDTFCKGIGPTDRVTEAPLPSSSIEVPPSQPSHKQQSTRALKSREVCQLPVAVGKCKGRFASWYYETATDSCVLFQYSGCAGNGNRFQSKNVCEETCINPVTPAAVSNDSVCAEAKETGPCSNFITKWYYRVEDGTCNRFHYGGCEGTRNRFDSELECNLACSNYQDACTLPKVIGPCSGKHESFFYNNATRLCEQFVYGGCVGNKNRFQTLAECKLRCHH